MIPFNVKSLRHNWFSSFWRTSKCRRPRDLRSLTPESVSNLPVSMVVTRCPFDPIPYGGTTSNLAMDTSVPITIPIPPGYPNATACFTVTLSNTFVVRKTDLFLEITTTPTYTLQTTPSPQTLTAPGTASFAISTPRANNFSSPITLSVTGIPTGISASISQQSPTGATLNVVAQSSMTAGTYTFAIVANGNGIQRISAVTLTILPGAGYSANVMQVSQSLTPNGSVDYKVSVLYVGGFNHALNLSVPTPPPGLSVTFLPSSSIAGSSDVTMRVSAASYSTIGSYNLGLTTTDQNTNSARLQLVAVAVVPPAAAQLVSPAPYTRIPNSAVPFIVRRAPGSQYSITVGSRIGAYDYLAAGSSSTSVSCPNANDQCDRYYLTSTIPAKQSAYVTLTSTMTDGSNRVERTIVGGSESSLINLELFNDGRPIDKREYCFGCNIISISAPPGVYIYVIPTYVASNDIENGSVDINARADQSATPDQYIINVNATSAQSPEGQSYAFSFPASLTVLAANHPNSYRIDLTNNGKSVNQISSLSSIGNGSSCVRISPGQPPNTPPSMPSLEAKFMQCQNGTCAQSNASITWRLSIDYIRPDKCVGRTTTLQEHYIKNTLPNDRSTANKSIILWR